MSQLLKCLHRYLIGCGQHRKHSAELYVDVENKLYSKTCRLKLQVRKNGAISETSRSGEAKREQ
jgi:hypothetical protein